jgi:NAD-dependent DNA ligase
VKDGQISYKKESILKNTLSEEEEDFIKDFYPALDLRNGEDAQAVLSEIVHHFKGYPVIMNQPLLMKKFLEREESSFKSLSFFMLSQLAHVVLPDESMCQLYLRKDHDLKEKSSDSLVIIKQDYDCLEKASQGDYTSLFDFHDKLFCITGRLQKMKKAQAAEHIAQKGGLFSYVLTSDTQVLVVADNKADVMTTKKATFLRYQEECGAKIMISEATFYKLIGL